MNGIAESMQTGHRAGMLAMVLAMLLFPIGDAISKLLTSIASPFEVSVWRSVAQALFFLPLAFALRGRLTGPLLTWQTLLSGALVGVMMVSLVSAFATMPIATAIAIFFVEPLLLTLLAGPMLGEVPGPRRYIAVAVGMVGALIVIRPNFAIFGPVALLPVVAAFAFALNMIVMRRATRRVSALTFQLGSGFCAAAVMLAAGALVALLGYAPTPLSEVPTWARIGVICAGILAGCTFLLVTYAFSRAEASLLAPFQYLEIVGATVVGLVVFGDFPDVLTWLGTGIILASGIYVFHRERQHDIGQG